MQNPVLQAIADRRSIRAYEDKPLTEEQINALLRAGVQAPSARNSQPWHFTVVRDQALIKEVNDAANEKLGRSGDIFYDAPLAIFLSADPEGSYSRMDCGIAVENIALAAHAMGLGSVILGLPEHAFKTSKADALKEKLKFPPGYAFMIAIAIGHPATTKDAHPVDDGKISFVG